MLNDDKQLVNISKNNVDIHDIEFQERESEVSGAEKYIKLIY